MKGLLTLIGGVFLTDPKNRKALYATILDTVETLNDVYATSSGILEKYLELRHRLTCRKAN